MNKFVETTKKPFVIAIIAGILYLIDALIAGLFVKNSSFMWVAFAFWTLFFSVNFKDRVKALIGTIIGFFAAVLMMLITNLFSLNIGTISISTLLGVIFVNFAVMFFEKAENFWLNSISGIFAGIMLTFSGLEVGLNPLNNFKEGSTMLAIICIYAILGLCCGFFSCLFSSQKSNNKEINQ